jgi:hypothetical protein
VVAKVNSTLLGWNRLGVDDKAANRVSPSIKLRHIVLEEHLESVWANSQTGSQCLDGLP